MDLINKEAIGKFLKRFSGRDENLSNCLYLLMNGPLQRDFSCLCEIVAAEELPSPFLHKKFNQRSKPWYRFEPSESATEKTKTLCIWLMDFLNDIDNDLSGELRRRAKEKLREIRTIEEAIERSSIGPLMTRNEIIEARAARLIPDEERRGHFHHESPFKGSMNLYRIMTTTGMDHAGEMASNCLKRPDAPDKIMPHRKRVRYPENWEYFILLDVNNNSVAVFMVDQKEVTVEYEGNRGQNIRNSAQEIVSQFMDYLEERNPAFLLNNPRSGYSGNINAPAACRF